MNRTRSLCIAAIFVVAACGDSSPAGGGDGAVKADLTTLSQMDDMLKATADMTMTGAATGAPCATDKDCGGTKPVCVLKDSMSTPWPGGYCSSACDPTKNDKGDPLGVNPQCPGGGGTCLGSGKSGACETACTAMSAGTPCTRTGYLCFNHVCEPAAYSQCNPTVKLSCPQDGGAPINDAGATAPRTCAKTGQDDVGTCRDGCDPLAAQKPGMSPPPCNPDKSEACYPNYTTGEGNCFAQVMTADGGAEGAACKFINNCDPGLTCIAGKCRQMCGGPKSVACPMGKTCTDLSTKVTKDNVGYCK